VKDEKEKQKVDAERETEEGSRKEKQNEK